MCLYLSFFIFCYFFSVDLSILFLNFIYYSWHCISIVIYAQLQKSRGLTPSGHSKFSNMSVFFFFLRNFWYASFTMFHSTIPGNLVQCLGSNISFGFQLIMNLTLSTCSPKNPMSSFTYLGNGMLHQQSLIKLEHIVYISH